MSYQPDMSNEEIMIKRLDTLIDLAKETLDVMQMILENQNHLLRYTGIDETKKDFPSGLNNEQHLAIQIEGLRGATEDLLRYARSDNQHSVNESMYCALQRLLQIVDNLGNRRNA